MDSSELYHIKQQFTLGAYKSVANLVAPDSSSPDYTSILLYKGRAYIALNDPKSVSQLIPENTENVALKAVASLARYVGASEAAAKDGALEELRDLCVEVEGDDAEDADRDKDMVRVLAGTGFARAGELEEALETLGAGTNTENLEAVAFIVQIYLSIHRVDLAKKEFERAKQWAEDDLLLQLIESSIGLVTGKATYSDSQSFYTEQLGNPSLSSPHLLTARGVVRLLRGEIPEAKSDLEESLVQQSGDAETQAAMVVAAGLEGTKKAEELWNRMLGEHPEHPMVVGVVEKSDAFDMYAAKFEVPPLAIPIATS